MQATNQGINNLMAAINNNRNTGKIVEYPVFYGRDDEDPHQWVELFEQAFTSNRQQEGVNQTNKINIAAGCMREAAFAWYRSDMANIQRWEDNTHNVGANDFKRRLLDQYSTPLNRNQWTMELQNTKQNMNESIEGYALRFRNALRKATHGNALAPVYQVNYFTNGLQPHIRAQTVMTQPGNLNDAINRAKAVEAGYISLNINQGNIMTDTIVNETQVINKPIKKEETTIDEITKKLSEMEIKLAEVKSPKVPVPRRNQPNNFNRGTARPRVNQNRNNQTICQNVDDQDITNHNAIETN
jgi:hypothetical protein